MSERASDRLEVKPGGNHDVCPLCGIHRENAGYLKESCGAGYLKPECFVAASPSSDGAA
jgi:hypothetical protein